MPTGVSIRDVRAQLFAAADRILLSAGPSALTSRAVTTEAGCAKGVLHKHFDDFDAFLAEYVLDRVEQMDAQAAALRGRVGTGNVVDHLTGALISLFESVAVAVVALVTFRDELRTRLRDAWPAGVPVLTEGAIMLGAYLADEQRLGRVPADADVETLAAMLIGSTHMLYADRATTPQASAVRRIVTTLVRSEP
ncbi:TetR/AcrR family transcriptional regulator [Kibdelosporangium phytohabitans]|uniref:TetR family transcriptional regulator n=1 Tax=Kibdelosporangium phytohabitans TaxID=860235 RepID=A0A0N9I3A2_9PSEU|nr:TetR/AcrR family transcriptional regulator [Kibdelosporangium phytohabitans]ALG12273.1 TetR family transcriptional regulator [Kibdelosporangium phytohabitans]MBE1463826.1 AcrR family transcriptional regulator [Kibdelosporangium phytohabitans]